MTLHTLRGTVRDAVGHAATADVSVDVASVPQPGPRILFAAQWRDLGRTSAARRDRTRFDFGSGCGVVTAESTGIAGWPTPNVLRVPAAAGDPDGSNLRIQKSGLPPLAVGMTRYFRIYGAITLSDGSSDDSFHPIESNSGSIEWVFPRVRVHDPGRWSMAFAVRSGSPRGFDNKAWEGGSSGGVQRARHTLFRFEWAITRTSATTFTVRCRLYDAAGTLLADDGAFRFNNGDVLGQTAYVIGSATNLQQILVGSNQGGWMPAGSNPQMYQAALAISDEGWLGPYNAATEAGWDA